MDPWKVNFKPMYPIPEEAGILDPNIESERFSFSDTGRLRMEKVNIPGYAICKPGKMDTDTKVILILPGGAYSRLAIHHEGWEVAQWLAKAGHVGILLKYRLPDPSLMTDPGIQPLKDAIRGIKVLKDTCNKMNIPIQQSGVLGFSAGGHLAAWATREYLKAGLHSQENGFPGFQILVYPVIDMHGAYKHQGSRDQLMQGQNDLQKEQSLSIHTNVDRDTIPTYLVHALDDLTVPYQNSQLMADACEKAGVPVEWEWLNNGGHGFGLYPTPGAKTWLIHALEWSKRAAISN